MGAPSGCYFALVECHARHTAELQARSKKPMYMHDWAKKLDDFLRILTGANSATRKRNRDAMQD